MRIPTHRRPEPAAGPAGPSRRAGAASPGRAGSGRAGASDSLRGGTVVFRSPDAAEVRWRASFATVAEVATLAAEWQSLLHLVLSVTLAGPDVVLHARVKNPGDTASRDRLRVLLERVS